jgi:O-antigen biosynthesis protein
MECDGNEPEERHYYLALASEVPDRARVLWVGAPPPRDFVSASRIADVAMTCVPRVAAVESTHAPAGSYDLVVVSLLAVSELAEDLPEIRARLVESGRVVVGIVHVASAWQSGALLASASNELSRLPTGTTLPALIATLATRGLLLDHVRAIRHGGDDPAPMRTDLAALMPSDPEIDFYVVAAHPGAIEGAQRAARSLAAAVRGEEDPGLVDAVVYDALMRQERQLANFDRSIGWRLLARYGPYKHRFVLPAWEALKDRLRNLQRSTDRPATAYDRWVHFAEPFHDGTLEPTAPDASTDGEPLVTVVVPVEPSTESDLPATIASVLAQSYAKWELRVAVVGAIRVFQDDRVTKDARFFFVDTSAATAAAATNAALADARGEIVLLMPFPVELAPDALAAYVRAFASSGGDVVYGDEDVRGAGGGRRDPDLKPAWSPDWLLARMYWPHVVAYRASLLRRVGPLRLDLEGVGHFDLALRATEEHTRVVHVPRILSHAREPESADGWRSAAVVEAGKRALESALERRGVTATVEPDAEGVYRVRRTIANPGPVTIIIPTRDNPVMLRRCLASLESTDHPRFEVVIVDNGSVDPATVEFLATTRQRVVRAPGPFNFARLNNLAVAEITGEYVVFLNDDTEVTVAEWLRALEEHAQRPEVGAVGAKLLYPNGRIQHAGIAVGIGGLAGHPYRFRRRAPAGVRNVSAVTAACLMMRRETFLGVGGFDERLPVNSNDVDLCLRLRDRGYLVVYTPYATLIHHESATRGLRATPDDAWLMRRRWRSVLQGDPYYSPNAELASESGAMDLSKPDGLVRVYDGAPGVAGDLRVEPGTRIDQSCYVAAPDLCAIVVRSAVTEGDPARALRLSVYAAPGREPLRVVNRSLPGRTTHERWFCFDPLAESAGRQWHFSLESRERRPFVVSRAAVVSDVAGPCIENGVPTYGTLVFELYARAPYRCVTSRS